MLAPTSNRRTGYALLLHLVSASILGTPLDSTWTLFPPGLQDFSPIPGITDKTIEDAEAEGLIFTHVYPNGKRAVVLPELFVEEILVDLTKSKDVSFHEVMHPTFGMK